MSPAPLRPGRPLEPATAMCAAMYLADLVPAYAFVFRLPSTDSRFTIYTADPDRYLIGATYTLTLAEPAERPLSLDPQDWELLAHCLDLVAERWAEAAEQADTAAAKQPTTDVGTDHRTADGTDLETQHDAPAQPEQESGPADTITVEPTATGYRHMGRMFRDELDRVQRLRRRVGQLTHTTDSETTDGETTGTQGELS
jgi:hypothetical protein